MAQRWWERDPARYASEREELDRAGFRYAVDEGAKAKGYLRINVFPVVNGEELPLIALFPDLYPWFKFELKAPTISLPHHQHPFARTLCLLPRDTIWWRPNSDRLAHFLRDRLQLVLTSGAGGPAATGVDEERQAEPFSDYYAYADGSILLIDGQWPLPKGNVCGTATIGVEAAPGLKPAPSLRGALLELKNERNDVLYSAPTTIAERYSGRLQARWVSSETPPAVGEPRAVFDALADRDPRAAKLTENRVQGGSLAIRVGFFPEEHKWRGVGTDVTGQGWLVGCRYQAESVQERQGARGRVITRRPGPQAYLARVGRYTAADVIERAPELRPLLTKSVAVVGLGCIGAPSVLEIVRAGVAGIRLADFDFFDPATALRWPRGLGAAGGPKTTVLEQIIQTDYPMVRVFSRRVRLGSVTEGEQDDWRILEELLDGVDLLYDASAESAVQHFLAMEARSRMLPYIAVFGTQGGFGGTIVRIRPGQTAGCWMCYLHASSDGRLTSPPASSDSRGIVQPTGCADPTFVGAGFDLAELALSGARLVASTLSSGHAGGYPETEWDVGVLHLRDDSGGLMPPTWTTSPLHRHPNCPVCNVKP
jgi:molybdopterin/thiamine biosynthesis adenylyltransferase